MGGSQKSNHDLSPFPTLKVTAMENSLSQAIVNFKDLVLEFEQLHLENINYKELLHKQQEKFESQICSSCIELRKVVATKEQIIDSITSALNKLIQTKDFNLIEEILKQIHGDTIILTPPKSVSPQKENNPDIVIKEKKLESTFKSPKKEAEDQICKDESVSEIAATPTGRKSPIFQSRRTKTHSSLSLKDNKKKCSDSWSNPESKAIKLTFPSPKQGTPGGRLRQGRLSFVKVKSCNVVDLTCSPENNREIRSDETNLQCNVKKEVIDNDETILPSPTSGPVKFPPLYKSMARDSPTKFKKPPIIITKLKMETETSDSNTDERKLVINENGKNTEDSINLLNQFPNRFKSPMKKENMDYETHCGDESISLLHHNMKKVDFGTNKQVNSPIKRPLAENVNITNMQEEYKVCPSVLTREPVTSTTANSGDDVKRIKTNMSPVYKEPTVRKKAEKRALPGWSCDQCRVFYDELYKGDPEMLAHLMDECSKHRGRTNPVRPKTPEGFWNPRWDVPQDTEEFNRRNNAI